MTGTFAPGDRVRAKDGRAYIVDEVEDGTVYCRSDGGAETEFAASSLLSEADWAAKSDGRRDQFYSRLKQSKAYVQAMGASKDEAGATATLQKIERLSPGLTDYAAFAAALRALDETGDAALADDLSVKKLRAAFDGAPAAARLGLMAHLLGMPPAALLDAGRLGDNLMRALIEKGLASQMAAFDEFLDRPRR
ncbi:MAG: hypothetical protein ACK4NA_13680 [Alphaproteobacteria bacterium]